MQPKEITENTIRFFSDTDPLAQIFKYKFCGHRKILTPIKSSDEATKIFGADNTKQYIEEIRVDYYARIMNEAGANYLYTTVSPSISAVAQTGNLTGDQIYSVWDGIIESIKRHLLLSCAEGIRVPERNIYQDPQTKEWLNSAKIDDNGTLITRLVKNPYEMDFRTIPETTTYLTALYINTAKSKDGFYIKKMAESYQTAEVIRHGGSPTTETTGIFNSIKRMFPQSNK